MSFEDFLVWHDITLQYVDLPSYAKGFAYYNGIGYLVIINIGCCQEQQSETLVHELIHIFQGHFSCPKNYEDSCEEEVHSIIKDLKDIYTIHFI